MQVSWPSLLAYFLSVHVQRSEDWVGSHTSLASRHACTSWWDGTGISKERGADIVDKG